MISIDHVVKETKKSTVGGMSGIDWQNRFEKVILSIRNLIHKTNYQDRTSQTFSGQFSRSVSEGGPHWRHVQLEYGSQLGEGCGGRLCGKIEICWAELRIRSLKFVFPAGLWRSYRSTGTIGKKRGTTKTTRAEPSSALVTYLVRRANYSTRCLNAIW